jgi:hypothetical protein
VKLYENETVFWTMPETRLYGDGPLIIQGCATFPTQGNVRQAARPARGYELLIQPGDSYRVFWDMTINGCTGQRHSKLRFWNHSETLRVLEQEWQRVMFTPGTYRVYLDVALYPQDPQNGQAAYRTSAEGKDVLVSASQ